jgi:hypothetical protein
MQQRRAWRERGAACRAEVPGGARLARGGA